MKPREKQAKAKREGRLCEVAGCDQGQFQRRRCSYHHLLLKIEEREARGDVCAVAGCGKGRVARGLCRGHHSTELTRERRARAREDERFARALASLTMPGMGYALGQLAPGSKSRHEQARAAREQASPDAGGGVVRPPATGTDPGPAGTP